MIDTLKDLIQEVKEDMCDHYCQYPALYLAKCDDPDDATEQMLEEKCTFCPLERLET